MSREGELGKGRVPETGYGSFGAADSSRAQSIRRGIVDPGTSEQPRLERPIRPTIPFAEPPRPPAAIPQPLDEERQSPMLNENANIIDASTEEATSDDPKIDDIKGAYTPGVSVISADDGGREVHKRVPDGDISSATDESAGEEQQQTPGPLQTGDSVTGPVGTGEFIKYEDRPQGRYAVIKVGDVETRVPEARFDELYSRDVEPAELADAEDVDLRTREKQELDALLSRAPEYNVENFGFSFATDEARTEFAEVIDEARENHYLFRSETRNPHVVSPADRDRGALGGIFTEGFREDDDKIYTTPDPLMALPYPLPGAEPVGWDGKKYLYVVNPSAVLENNSGIITSTTPPQTRVPLAEGQLYPGELQDIASGTIPPEFIAYSVEIDERSHSVVSVLKNPGYLNPEEAAEPQESAAIDHLTRRQDALRQLLENDTDDVAASYNVDQLGLEYGSDRARTRVAELMDRAREGHFLFHSDTRHPTRVRPADQARGITAAIFDEGLVAQSDERGFGVFSTPIVATAMSYPEAHEAPEGWDGKKYLYFIDPEGVIDDPDRTHRELGIIGIAEELASSADRPQLVEVESGTIAPHRVAYCLEIDNDSNRLVRVFTNKRYNTEPPQRQ